MPIALTGFIIATIGAEFATTFNNAMMTRLVPPERLGWLSGTGWAHRLSRWAAFAGDYTRPARGRSAYGQDARWPLPIFGLDAAAREGDRFSGR